MNPDTPVERPRVSPFAGGGDTPFSTRRQALVATSSALAAAVAGCATVRDTDSTPTDRPYERLRATPTYLDADVELSLPDGVTTVSAPADAGLLVFSGEPDVDAERAAEWLADDRVLALLGDGAEGTWIEWVQTDAFAEAFDTAGYGRANPEPDLLVGAAFGDDVTRYNTTWGNGPDDADVNEALEEAIADIETRPPRP